MTTLAPHVAAAIARGQGGAAQAKLAPSPATGSPHVAAAVAAGRGGAAPQWASKPILSAPRIVQPFRPTVAQRAARARYVDWSDQRKSDFAAAFLLHARALAPVTADAPAGLDAVAQHVVPPADLNCGAVEDPGAPANYNYATNSNQPAPGAIAALGGRGFARVNNPEPRLHAEMRIYQNNPGVAYIGISKRCCLLCQLAFSVVGFGGTRGCHGELFDAWVFPNFIRNTPANLTGFLGAGAAAIYNQLSPANQGEALKLIQGNLKQYDK
ncbi:MAG TPA: nucleic acid/nucleotide deaminase domain-containing protein [Thermoanaerobaculia bacterium]|nr:nucleic acid/nucleotide deaminase domain-containing protein [Thermoanaerobaculia bacterium]